MTHQCPTNDETKTTAPAQGVTRRRFLSAATAGAVAAAAGFSSLAQPRRKALVAITLDLEMSAEYPKRGMTEWNYRKGDLDPDTKRYAVKAAELAKDRGGLIHFFAVGQTLEQEDVGWLKELAAAGHPIGNHTYDHVNLKAARPEDVQYRFRRSPWLIRGKTVEQVIEENIATTTAALKERCGITANGFRTPGGFNHGLKDRPDLQKMLLKQGFTWVSSLYPSHKCGSPKQEPGDEVYADILRAQAPAQPFEYPSGLVEVPMSPVSDVTAFRTHYWKLDWFLKAVRLAVEEAVRTGGVFDFLAHPSCLVVEDPSFEVVKLLCGLVKDAGEKAAVTDLGAIAARGKDVPQPKE
ncbi:MAG TPA: polysaccharide deacetylase family protein [Gemmataceae bacterium]|nr:polysaccharide deacetylase family protein [Gemmataceae bacterium]